MTELKPIKPLSGFIELSPYQQKIFDNAASRIKQVFETAGFMHLDLPTIERAEVLGGSADEVSTQIYFFEKGDTKMGLRYDGTVGFARYISGHNQDLFFPFRSYQFAKNYRGERPQKGRYREFYQMDIDVIDENYLSENYDAEIIKVMSDSYKAISDLIGDTFVKIGSRPFWNAMFNYLELNSETSRAVFSLVDKKDKLSDEDFKLSLIDLIGNKKTDIITEVFNNNYKELSYNNKELMDSINNLIQFENTLKTFGLNSKDYEIDLSIMRGHGYYTGIVFEFFSRKFPQIGAIGGGGRYENLCQDFINRKFIGVGGAIGFSRMMVSLLENDDICSPVNVCKVTVLPIDKQSIQYAIETTKKLRDNKIQTIAYLDETKKFKKQMEFSNKINTKFVIIIGESEVKNNTLTIKNMETGEQITTDFNTILNKLQTLK